MNQSIESILQPKTVPEAMTEDMENDEDELFDETLLNQSAEEHGQLKDARYQEEYDAPIFGGVVENTDDQQQENMEDE